MSLLHLRIGALALSLSYGAAVLAAPIDLTYAGPGPFEAVKGRVFDWSDAAPTTELFSFTGGQGAAAGYYRYQGAAGNPAPFDGAIWGFCLEPHQDTPAIGASRPFDPTALVDAPKPGLPVPGTAGMGAAKADAIARAVFAAYQPFGGVVNWTSLDSRSAAALNAAIWEIIYEKPGETYNPDAGYSRLFNGIATTLNSNLKPKVLAYLAAASDPAAPQAIGLLALTHSELQDFLVPEPATAILLVAGLAALRRREAR